MKRLWNWFLGLFWKDHWMFCAMCDGIGLLESGTEIRWKVSPFPGDTELKDPPFKKGCPYPPTSMLYNEEEDYPGARNSKYYLSRNSLHGETCPQCTGLRKTYRSYAHNAARRRKIMEKVFFDPMAIWQDEFKQWKKYAKKRRKQKPTVYVAPPRASLPREDESVWKNEGEGE